MSNLQFKNTINIENVLTLDIFTTEQPFTIETQYNIPVKSINLMDIAGIENWVNADELLIIGAFFEDKEVINADKIEKLAEKHISGIITKEKFIPFITQDIISACAQHNIPILITQDAYSWSQVFQPVTELINAKQLLAEIKSRDFLTQLIKSLNNYNFLNAYCESIFQITNFTIAITDASFQLVDYSKNFDWKTHMDYLFNDGSEKNTLLGYKSNQQAVYGYTFSKENDKPSDKRTLAFHIRLQNIYNGYLLIYANAQSIDTLYQQTDQQQLLSPSFLFYIETIINVYNVKNLILKEINRSNLSDRDLMFYRLKNDKNLTAVEQSSLYAAIEVNPNSPYYLMVFESKTIGDAITHEQSAYKYFNIYAEIEKKINDKERLVNLFRYKNLLVFLIKQEKFSDVLVDQLIHSANHIFDCQDIYTGISNAHALDHFDEAWTEAYYALSYAKSYHNATKKYYDDLGILEVFISQDGQLNTHFIDTMLARYIQPLRQYDEEHHTDLLLTLESYIENNQSNKLTSEQLHIHINTLRARLERIEAVLQIQLYESSDLLSLMIAMDLYRTLNEKSKRN